MPRSIKVIPFTAEAGWRIVGKPAEGRCQVCATAHEPELPHNQQSLHYQYSFHLLHGRFPTWADAMAHCDPETQRLWTEELRKLGAAVADA